MLIQLLALLLGLSLGSCSQPLRLNFFILWNEIFLAISVGKKCHSHQWFLMWIRVPIQWMLPPLTVTTEELAECKKQGEQWNRTGPRELRCTGKEGIQGAQRLASSHTQKNAKFLSLLSALLYLTIISDVQTACLLCYKLLYSLTPSPASSGALYSGLLRCCLQSLESLTFPPSKITLYFQVVTNFLAYKYVQLEH